MLLGIDWTYENYAVIDLKKDTMTFEAEGIKVVQPLDPYVGPRYTEPTNNNMEGEYLDQLYTVTTRTRNNYINPTVDGSVRWRSIQSAVKIQNWILIVGNKVCMKYSQEDAQLSE
jgi:hypothetical protein